MNIFTAATFILFIKVESIGGDGSQMRILTKPRTFQKPIGGNITFPCSVLNLDGSVITWSKDGQVISADTFKVLQDMRMQVSADANDQGVMLTVSGLKLSDSGQYVCALNTKHSVLSVVHTLNIEVPPTIHNLHPRNGTITVRSGSRVRLECKASGQPHPSIYWTRMHNQPFTWDQGSNVTVLGEVLTMSNITRSYSGDYVCNADNGVGHWPVTQIISLNVLYAPDVETDHKWIHCGEGETVTLICRVYSNPVARVLWYKDTMKLIQGDRIHTEQVGDTYKLTVSRVGIQDYGNYFCKASNLLDKEVSAKMVLTGAPSIPHVIGDMTSSQMYSYDVVWTVESQYPLLQHEIIYWILGTRDPRDPRDPPDHAVTRRVPGPMASRSGNESRYTVMGLHNNTFYNVMLRSQNKFGWSPFSSVFTFQTMDKLKLTLTLQEPNSNILDTQGPLKSEPVVSSCPRVYQQSNIIFTFCALLLLSSRILL